MTKGCCNKTKETDTNDLLDDKSSRKSNSSLNDRLDGDSLNISKHTSRTYSKQVTSSRKTSRPNQATNSKSPISNKDGASDIDENSNDDPMDKDKMLIKILKIISEDLLNDSYTKKFLTESLVKQEINIRTADNVGLGSCVYCNVNNYHAKFPYAITADCYCVFCDFFGPLIDYYHDPPQEEAELEALFGDVDRYESLDLNYNNRSRVLYCEVVIRRNIDGIIFTPRMNSDDRKSVINKVEPVMKKICENEKEVAKIPMEWCNRFDEIKNELDDIGSMEDYPKDRVHLIYDTAGDSRLGAVLNFDDHIQLISSTNDGKIGYIYKNLHWLYTHPKMDELEFVAHPILGFLTINPKYIGLGFSIKLIAKFPFVSRFVDLNNTFLRGFNVVIELENPDCPQNGLICLSNKKTLNKTEEQTLMDVVNVFHILYELEEEVELNTPLAVQHDYPPVECLQRLYNNLMQSESKSYTKKYLTPTLLEDYKLIRTKFDNTLAHCIRCNSYYTDCLYPRAADAYCYVKFNDFFVPILYECNKTSSIGHPLKPHYSTAGDSAQFMIIHKHISSYRVRFTRNFAAFPFPMSMSDKQRGEVEEIMLHLFDEIPVEIEGDYYPLEDIRNSIDFEEICENNILPHLTDVDKCTGAGRNWASKRGIYLCRKYEKDPNLILYCLVNVIDHIKVVCIDPSGRNLAGCYDRAVTMMKFFDLRFERKYARKAGFGYFTSLPQNVGCGMRVSAKLLLKNLGNNREVLEKRCKGLQFAIRGTKGAGSPAINNVFDLSLKLNLNVTERYILLTFCQRLKDLILFERDYDVRFPKPENKVFLDESSSNSQVTSTLYSNSSRRSNTSSKASTTAPDDYVEAEEIQPVYPAFVNDSSFDSTETIHNANTKLTKTDFQEESDKRSAEYVHFAKTPSGSDK